MKHRNLKIVISRDPLLRRLEEQLTTLRQQNDEETFRKKLGVLHTRLNSEFGQDKRPKGLKRRPLEEALLRRLAGIRGPQRKKLVLQLANFIAEQYGISLPRIAA